MFQIENIFVVPGARVKVPLPIPGGGAVPAAGAMVGKTSAVRRLLSKGDLVETVAPAAPAPEASKAKG